MHYAARIADFTKQELQSFLAAKNSNIFMK
jgi:hypothetical protein